ncbi:hypothetical protein QVD17_37975 [Tagetes erecta]|uniref:Uncharacterized protein n=1 Tax=Tagetes erecta TaxID=13708 RepID=A0AAD8JXS5_TARER|nr:hypothetical protein QVD17_37975 [Tagetes erecta]
MAKLMPSKLVKGFDFMNWKDCFEAFILYSDTSLLNSIHIGDGRQSESEVIGIVTGKSDNYTSAIKKGSRYNTEPGKGRTYKFLMFHIFLQHIEDYQLPDLSENTRRLIQSQLRAQVFRKVKSNAYRGQETNLFSHMLNEEVEVDSLLVTDAVIEEDKENEKSSDKSVESEDGNDESGNDNDDSGIDLNE